MKSKAKTKISAKQKEHFQQPTFSFKHLTKNQKYNFSYFSDKNEEIQICRKLTSRLYELSNDSFVHLGTLPKGIGFELLTYGEIKFDASGIDLNKDDKVMVFRFNEGKCRIIGYKDNSEMVYIIGFDFNYSAYKH